MSSIDNRIVQMQFENSRFEKGIKESLDSIEKLDKALKFEGAEKGIESLQKAGDSFSLVRIAEAADSVADRFSAMGLIGMRVLQNITDSAYRAGVALVKSLSVDQISTGFSKYEDKTKSVQTIVNATGLGIEEVDEQLSKLAWFTDETSYSFVDMVSNIGKFTSMNIPLDKSVTAMEGIATWAAVSGQGVNEASRAMYNLSQAMGMGSVRLMDWRSIENSNMATSEFKQTAIDTAIAMGVLKKGAKTAKGTAVNYKNFSNTLQEGWFTSDVLMKTLEKYGEYADEVYKVASEEGITAAEAMERVSSETMKLGAKAFKAAQEAKTFTEAIEAIKDAVSTGWMNTFEIIFGNYEEAKVLWTDLANGLYDVFAVGAEQRNEVLQEWKDLGGRESLLKGVYSIFEALYGVILAVKEALAEIFPPVTVEQLTALSTKIEEFGEHLKTVLYYSEYIKKTLIDTGEAAEKAEPVIQSVFGGELKIGDRSEEVRELQKELIKLGYLDKNQADGIFGPKTQKAVREFQKAERIVGDGIFNEKTFRALEKKGAYAGTAFTESLKKGSKGSDVKELQKKLIELGYLEKTGADGIFGPKTEAALKKYQEAQKLVANGIYDEKTFKAMYPQMEEQAKGAKYSEETIRTYGTTLTNVQRIVKGGAAAISIFGQALAFVGKVAGYVISIFKPLGDVLVDIIAIIADNIVAFDSFLKESGTFDKWFESVKAFLQPLADWIQSAADALRRFFGIGKEVGETNEDFITFAQLWANIKKSIKDSKIFDKLKKSFNNLGKAFDKIKPKIKDQWESLKKNLGEKFTSFIESLPEKITTVTNAISNLVSGGIDLITPWIEKIPGAIDKVKEFWSSITDDGDEASGKAPGFLAKIKKGFQSVIDYLFGKGDVEGGRKPGLFSRLGKLISGDMDGFTEGLSEEDKAKTLERIQKLKDFFQRIREAISLLFTGKVSEDTKLSETTVNRIIKLRDSLAKVFEAIALLFTGEVKKESKLSEKSIAKIVAVRKTIVEVLIYIKRLFDDIWTKIKGIFTGEIKFDSIQDLVSTVFNGIRDFFSNIGNIISVNFGTSTKALGTFFTNLWKLLKKILIWGGIIIGLYKVGSLLTNLSGALKSLKETIASYKKTAQPLSKTIMQIAISIGVIAAAIWLIGQLDSDQFKRGIIAVAGIIVLLGGLTALSLAFLKKDSAKAVHNLGKAILDFAIAIGIIVGSILVLGIVPWPTIISGIGKLAVVMLLLVGFMRAVNKLNANQFNSKGLWEVAIVIGVMAVITKIFYGMDDPKRMVQGLIGLTVVMVLISHFMSVVGKTNTKNIKIKGFISLAILIGVMALIAKSLGKMKLDNFIQGMVGLIIIMGTIAGLTFVMGKFGGNIKIPSLITLLISMASLVIVMRTFAKSLEKIKGIKTSKITAFASSIAGLMVAFATVGAIAGKVGAVSSFLGIISVAAGLAVVITAFSALLSIPKVEQFLSNGAEKIGKLVGNFIGAMKAAEFESFGKAIGNISSIGTVDQSKIDSAIAAAQAISDFGDGLPDKTNFTKAVDFFFGSKLKQFSDDMATFGTSFNKFATEITKITADTTDIETKTKSAVLIASAIESFGSNLPEQTVLEKVANNIFGSELKQFSGDMVTFGTSFNTFATEIGKLTADTTDIETKTKAAVAIASSIKDFAYDLPEQTVFEKVANNLFGSEFKQFSGDMITFGTSFNTFAAEIAKLTADTTDIETKTKAAVAIAGAIKDFAYDLPEQTIFEKVANNLFGSELKQFSGDMVTFGTSFNTFATEMAKITADTTDIETKTKAAVAIASAIESFGSNLPEQTVFEKVANNLFGSELKQFSGDMVTFGTSFNTFATEIAKITADTDDITTKSSAAVLIASAIESFGSNLPEQTVLEKVANRIFGSELKQFSGDMVAFGTSFNTFATEMNKITANTDEIATKTTAAVSIATEIENFSDGLPEDSVFGTIADKILGSELKRFSGDMTEFATKFNDFATSMNKIPMSASITAKTTSAVKIAEQLEKFSNGLASKNFTTVIKDKIFGSTLDDFSGDMTSFAEKFNTYVETIGGIDYEDSYIESTTATAVNVATQIATFLSTLSDLNIETKLTGINAWFNGSETKGETVIDSVSALASAIKDSKDSFVEMGSGEIEAGIKSAVSAIKSVGELLAYLNDNSEMFNNLDGLWSIEDLRLFLLGETAFGHSQYGVADLVKDYVNAVSGLEDLKSAFEALSVITELSKFLTSGPEVTNTFGTEFISEFEQAGENFVTGLANGVDFNAAVAIAAAEYVATMMLLKIKSVFNSASPSKETEKYGQYFGMGLVKGVEESTSAAENSATDIAEAMLSSTSTTLASLSRLLSEDIDTNPVITPVVDLSSARQSASLISDIFGTPQSELAMTKSLAVNATYGADRKPLDNYRQRTVNTAEVTKDSLESMSKEFKNMSNTDVVSELQELRDKFGSLAEAVTNMKLVLDTGALVGGTYSAYDRQFGKNAAMRERGN